MTSSERELSALATELIGQKGSGAITHAMRRAEDLRKAGHDQEANKWLLIAERVNELRRRPIEGDDSD